MKRDSQIASLFRKLEAKKIASPLVLDDEPIEDSGHILACVDSAHPIQPGSHIDESEIEMEVATPHPPSSQDDSEDEYGQEGKVISNPEKDGSAVDDDDDEKSVTESEFAAFLEKGRAEYQRYWEEEFLPRNPHMVFKDFSKEGDD